MDYRIPCPNNVLEGELANTFQKYCPPELQIVEANAGTRNNKKFPCVWVVTYRVRDSQPGATTPFRCTNFRIYKEAAMIKPRNTEIINHHPIKTGDGQFWIFEYGIVCYCTLDQTSYKNY